MSTALKQFLHEQAKKHQDGKETVAEWRSAIERLYGQIREWLKESDADGVMEVEQTDQIINEPGVGHYLVPRLNLYVVGKWIGIVPKARLNAGSVKPPGKSTPERAEGRIDITDEVRRYFLFRHREKDKDVWMIDGLEKGLDEAKAWPGQVQFVPRSEQKLFNQEAFEKALLSYLQ